MKAKSSHMCRAVEVGGEPHFHAEPTDILCGGHTWESQSLTLGVSKYLGHSHTVHAHALIACMQ